ncbi:MAG: lysophospholipid acyltransferase family protein [Myxococcota bacterium]
MSITSLHMLEVPHDASLEESSYRAHRWGTALVRACGIDVHITGEIPPRHVLLVSNHRSYIDIGVLLSVVPCCFLAKDQVKQWPILGEAARRGGTVFVEREDRGSRQAARETLQKTLSAGHTVAVFPEGTTAAAPGCGALRPGAFESAAQAGVPVIPLAIEYGSVDDAWVGEDTFVDHFLRRFSSPRMDAYISFGPILRDGSGAELHAKAQEWISARLMHEWETRLNTEASLHATPRSR